MKKKIFFLNYIHLKFCFPYLELPLEVSPHLNVYYRAFAIQPLLNLIQGCFKRETFLDEEKTKCRENSRNTIKVENNCDFVYTIYKSVGRLKMYCTVALRCISLKKIKVV